MSKALKILRKSSPIDIPGYDLACSRLSFADAWFESCFKGLKQKHDLRCAKCGKIFSDTLTTIPACNCFPASWKYAEAIKKELKGVRQCLVSENFVNVLGTNYEILINDPLDGQVDPRERSKETWECTARNKNLIHVWLNSDPRKVVSRLKHILGKSTAIGARKTTLCTDREKLKKFIRSVHLHGLKDASQIYVGLEYRGKIVSAISASYRESVCELDRYVTAENVVVSGGLLKMIKRIKTPEVKRILTYADRDWTPLGLDSVYFKCGFSYYGDTGPIQFYVNKEKEVFSRQKYSKKFLGENYDHTITVHDNLAKLGIFPVYNSGNHKFILNCN